MALLPKTFTVWNRPNLILAILGWDWKINAT
jgi:hypothetical protein